ncbi:MAG: radical SAM protein [Elusimicrobia bacterium]|nr:radical SAM protein [Elusimicrobiota bacterium]
MLLRVKKNCNQKCVFCSFDSKKENARYSFSALAQSLPEGKELIQISGGEPLLCDPVELLKLCVFLCKKGKTIEFQTNAVLLPQLSENYVKKLADIINLSKGYFNINFSSADADTDYKITRTKNAFDFRLKAVKKIKKLKVPLRLTFVVNSLNFTSLEKFARLALSLKPDLVQFSFVKGQGSAFGKKRLIPPYEKVSPYIIKAMEILSGKGINFEADHIPSCHLGKFWRKNVDTQKALSKIKGPHMSEKKHVGECLNCEIRNLCFGPRKDYLKIRKFKKGKILK